MHHAFSNWSIASYVGLAAHVVCTSWRMSLMLKVPAGRNSQHSTAQHSTAQHSTAQHSTAQHSTAQHSTAHSIMKQTAPGCSIGADHGAEDLLASPQLNRLHNGGHRQVIALSCIPHVCAQKPKLTPAVEAVLGSHQKGRRQKVLHTMLSWSNST